MAPAPPPARILYDTVRFCGAGAAVVVEVEVDVVLVCDGGTVVVEVDVEVEVVDVVVDVVVVVKPDIIAIGKKFVITFFEIELSKGIHHP